MFRETVLSRAARLACTGGMLAGFGLLAQPALAQQAAASEAQSMQRVEVTGSSIKRLQAEAATTVTVIKADEFAKQGLTTAQEVLARLPSNQSSLGSGNTVGGNASGKPTGGQAEADLRALGGNKTLVLLNGRRLANHPYEGATVDLNMIPLSALDRVEVLRDGASAIYGTDAIGGVINFITKRSVELTTITGEMLQPKQSGGKEKRVNLSSGFGNFDKEGFNIFGVADWHKADPITSQQRDFSKTGINRALGLDVTSGTTFPANYFDPTSGVAGNPGFATGCNPPLSVPSTTDHTCRQDYTRQIDDTPPQEQAALFTRGSLKLSNDHTASFEYLHSENKVQSRTAPPPQTGLTLPNTSKYYPGNAGGVPAQAGLSGDPLSVNWRPLEAGQRVIDGKGEADRMVLALDGVLFGWDYKAGLSHSISKSKETFSGGYVKDSTFAQAVQQGLFNPFGPQDATGNTAMNLVKLRGEVQNAADRNTSVDLKASRDLMALPGGQMALALGTELRRERANFNVDQAVASESASSGLSGSLPTSGRRNIEAFFSELSLPLVKDLEVQLAARYDKYSDVGSTTNPKIGVRYQPSRQLLLRGSASSGFRAPTLFEKNAPASKNDTNDSYSDPVLCPGGVVSSNPVANPLRDCNLQQFKVQGGNANLQPEKSKTFSLGAVVEPVKEVTLALDYWQIKLRDRIAALPEQSIYADYARYKDLFLRNVDGSPYAIRDLNDNLGQVKTDGVDVSLNLRLPRSRFGAVSIGLDGTYVHKYDYQNERDGAFIHAVGRYSDDKVVFRWQHLASLNWSLGNWSATLSESYKSSYLDQNPVPAHTEVAAYSLWNLSGSYTGVAGLTVTAGVKNLLDQEPPFSNQGTLFQKGYDPRYSDPVGRALYLRASYAF
jgi:iron complex outermembrane receptor protein